MRRTELINNEWMFTDKNNKQIKVNIPHTWNAVDGQDGGNDYYRGTCIYEKTLVKPSYSENERVFLQFDGVNATATVIFNEETLCIHNNGYSAFRVEVTDLLQDINHIKVLVDNSKNDKVYLQYGVAWWLLDHIRGISDQIDQLMETGLLSGSVGMLTDSRAFTSFVRHEYFRRILCNKIGILVEDGQYPNDIDTIGKIVQNICWKNAVEYFNFNI